MDWSQARELIHELRAIRILLMLLVVWVVSFGTWYVLRVGVK